MVSVTTARAPVLVEKPGRDRARHGDDLGHPVGFQGQALLGQSEPCCFGKQAFR